MRTIFILLDSLNRRYLSPYSEEQITPNIQRLADKGTVFNNHWCGSAPCMPARRDIFTGRLNFLERPWGGIEPFDQTLPQILNENGVFTQIITDHLHYFEIGGENYCNRFTCWDFIRGQEVDQWKLTPAKRKKIDLNKNGYASENYEANRMSFLTEQDYPTPKTLKTGADWIEENHDCDDFFLWIEGFDPHEPFDTPSEYKSKFSDNYQGEEFIWPEYRTAEHLSETEREHMVNRYKSVLSMTDKHVGDILDILDKYNMWEDTTVILTTDHGYMLGEHELVSKNYMHAYNEVFHIPLIVSYPGGKKTQVDSLTQNIDIFPTVLELYEIGKGRIENKIHGKSLIGLLNGETESIRDSVIYGYYGKTVNITDGEYTYFRAPVKDNNQPLNLYTCMPTMLNVDINESILDDRSYDHFDFDRFLKWTKYPVIRMEATNINWYIESQNFQKRTGFIKDSLLFDIKNDYKQNSAIENEAIEKKMIDHLKKQLTVHDSPDEQFKRLGLS